MTRDNLTILNRTKGKLPSLPFVLMKNTILGKDYELSLNIVGKSEIKKLNLIYRNINEPTDVLSFPLSKKEGEMFLNLQETRRMAKDFDRSYENFLGYLFIHGLVHLKGHDHGPTMDKLEEKFRKQFGI